MLHHRGSTGALPRHSYALTVFHPSPPQSMGKFSWGNPRTARRKRRVSGMKSDINQLPHPGGECNPGVLGHSRRGGQSGKPHIPSGNSSNLTSPGPLRTGKHITCWDRCHPLSSIHSLTSSLVIYEFSRLPVGSHQVTMLS
jgi:hypothetical protein